MLSSPIIDLAIGLTFVFGVTAALASLITEWISRMMGLRGAYLLTGLRELVDNGLSSTDLTKVEADYAAARNLVNNVPPPTAQPVISPPAADQPSAEQAAVQKAAAEQAGAQNAEFVTAVRARMAAGPSVTAALLGGPILGNQGVAGQLSSRKLTLGETNKTGGLPKMIPDKTAGRLRSQLRSLPAYISSRSFAEAVVDLVVPDAQGHTNMAAVEQGVANLPDAMPFKGSLVALVKNADGDMSRFRTSVEKWYDDHMDRVSGWYKRYAARITLGFGVVIVVLLNLNAITIGRTLYTESAVSTAVSAVAAKAPACTTGNPDCLGSLEDQISAAASAGLPIGWGTARDCVAPAAPATQHVSCNWMDQRGIFSPNGGSLAQLLLVLAGFLIMVISILPGAQFWFGLLSKLGTLRSTGPKPASGQ